MKRYLLILLLFTSCATHKGATKYFNSHQLEAAEYCAEKFPIIEYDSVRIDTVTTFVTIKGDSVECPPVANPGTAGKPAKPVKVKCPDITYAETTIREYHDRLRENTANLYIAEAKLANEQLLNEQLYEDIETEQKERVKAEAKVKEKNAYILRMWLALIAALVWIFRKPLGWILRKAASLFTGVRIPFISK